MGGIAGHTAELGDRRWGNEALQEIALTEIPHLAAPYGESLCKTATFGLELPYASIGGLGFERLCFHLLLSQGHKPRFFGSSGNAQFGIDLIVGDGAESCVYQCKNKEKFTAANLKEALEFFAEKWLVERPFLLRPRRFVLCCTSRLNHRDDWEVVKQAFVEKHGVKVEEWHRDTLDAWLRGQPDIVADLFGNEVAERFCDHYGWNDGLFRPLLFGSGEKDIDRYLELRKADRLVHDSASVTRFREILVSQSLILIEGSSGNGKTMTALDLATSLSDGAWRVFFVSLRNGCDEQRLFEGIKDRCVRPTLFILDDCHRDLATTERVVSRARHALRGKAFGLVLTVQTTTIDTEDFAGGSAIFVQECREQGLALVLAPTIQQYREILARVRPSLSGLSHESMERLYDMTARDLALLDIVLDAMEDRALADVGLLSDLFPKLLRRYFDGHEKVYAPNLKALAAIAQFDIAVPVGLLPDPFENIQNLKAVERLTVRLGQPASLTFVHASAAEMIFRALSWADADADGAIAAANAICSHLSSILKPETFHRILDLILRTRLRLADDSDLKQVILSAPEIVTRLGHQWETMPLGLLSKATFLTRSRGRGGTYSGWLATRLERMITYPESEGTQDVSKIGFAFRSLALADPEAHAGLETLLGGAPMLRLIRANGAIFELFRVLQYSTPGFAGGLIAALDGPTVTELIEKTIAEGRSIGTLDFTLRELAERDMPEGGSQLAALESLLGVAPMLRLIRANGTIFELFKVLQRSTPGFAAGLIAALDGPTVTELIEKTVAEGRSIGTLAFTLRELAERDMPEGGSQLAALESLLGGAPMLRLIRANGTIFELFNVLQRSTPGFAAGLIAALDGPTVTELIEKTIAEGRSIGTLDFTLRELAERDMPEGGSQLAALESLLGGAPMLRLIRANGTIFELFKVLQRSTPGFAAGLIAALNGPTVTELIEKTVAEGRSIGTLAFTLRELAERDMPEGGSQLAALESLLGGAPMLRLIRANGTIFELFRVLQYSTAGFAAGLIAALDGPTVTELIEKSVAEGRSIGTLHLALRELAERDMPEGGSQLAALESLLGGAPMLRLIRANGTIVELFNVLRYSTPGFAEGLIAALDGPAVAELIEKTITGGRSIGTLSFTLRTLRRTNPESCIRLEQLVGIKGFWHLVCGAGDFNDLAYLIGDFTPVFRNEFLAPESTRENVNWLQLARRSSFYAISRFSRDCINYLSAETQARFETSIAESLDEIVEGSSWTDLGAGLAAAEQITLLKLRDTLERVAFARIDRQDIDLLSFADFIDAANGILCLWRRREASRPELGRRFWSFLPEERSWPKDYNFFVGGATAA